MSEKHSIVRGLLADSQPEPPAPIVESAYIRTNETLEEVQDREDVRLEEASQGHNVPFKTDEIGTKPARVGIRMPTNPGKAADMRPVHAFDGDGTHVGSVKAIVQTPQEKNEIVGNNPARKITYIGQRVYPDGTQSRFDTEAAAKKFVADGHSVTWKKSQAARPERALEAKKGKPVNPWAVCTASAGREDKAKYERCIQDVKKKHPVKESQAMDYDLQPAKIQEGEDHSVMWLSLAEMRIVCPPCASKMENRGLSRIKVVYTEAEKTGWPRQIKAGRFQVWCRENGHPDATRDCLKAAMASKKGTARSMAESFVAEGKLAHAKRKGMEKGSFALPGKRKYPIHDLSHARNALARVSAHGTTSEKKTVRAAVSKRYPSLSDGRKKD